MKKLILEYIETINDVVSFRIKDQSHRCDNFGSDLSSQFCAKNGFDVTSIAIPANYHSACLYVRGIDKRQDNVILTASIVEWNEIKEAVHEYNDYFGYHGKCIINEITSDIIPMEMFEL